MWYNLSLDGVNFRSGYLHKLGVYTEFVTVPMPIIINTKTNFKKYKRLPIISLTTRILSFTILSFTKIIKWASSLSFSDNLNRILD